MGSVIGVLALAGMLLILPAGGRPGDAVRLPLAAGALAAFTLVMLGAAPRRWSSRAMAVALIVFGGVYAVSIAASLDPVRSAIRSAGIPMSVIVGLLSMRLGSSARAMRCLAIAGGLSVALLLLDLLWQRGAGVGLIGGLPRTPRQQGSLPNANDVAMAAPLAALATAGLDLRRGSGRLAASLLVAMVLLIWHLSDSRNLLLGLAAAGIGCVTLRRRAFGAGSRWTLILLFAAVPLTLPWTSLRHRILVDRVAASPAIAPATAPPVASNAETDAATSSLPVPSLVDRLAGTARGRIFMVAGRTAVQHPVLGCGPGLFAEAWWHFEGGAAWGEIAPDVGYMPWAHNLWLEAFAERGAVGLASLLLLVAAWLRLAWGVLRMDLDGGGEVAPAAAAISATLGLLAMSLFDLTLLKEWVGLLLFLSIGATAGAAIAISEAGADRVLAGRPAPPPRTAPGSADGSTA